MHQQISKQCYKKPRAKILNYIIVALFSIISIAIVTSLSPELGVLGTIAASISALGYAGVFAMIMLVE